MPIRRRFAAPIAVALLVLIVAAQIRFGAWPWGALILPTLMTADVVLLIVERARGRAPVLRAEPPRRRFVDIQGDEFYLATTVGWPALAGGFLLGLARGRTPCARLHEVTGRLGHVSTWIFFAVWTLIGLGSAYGQHLRLDRSGIRPPVRWWPRRIGWDDVAWIRIGDRREALLLLGRETAPGHHPILARIPVRRLYADIGYLAAVIGHYAGNPESRAAIGSEAELSRLHAIIGTPPARGRRPTGYPAG